MHRPQTRRAQLSQDLAGAVERGEILAAYQPQYGLETGKIVAAEILSRWEHPVLGMIPPAEFVPIAEETGAIDDIGDHMFLLACVAAAEWHSREYAVTAAVNVSLRQVGRSGFAERCSSLVTRSSVDPRMLTVEITESTSVTEVPEALHRLALLAASGITISADDFGVGHTSIEQVTALQATELKIDQSLVRAEGPKATGRLADAVAFGKSRNMRLVAEGIETDIHLHRVRALGCERGQGYLWARPMRRSELEDQITSNL